jgi:flagellar hook-associated protein 2
MTLNLSFVDQGAASSMQLGGSKQQNTFRNLINEGSKAFYMLDGMAVSSQSNTDSKTVVGTKIELKQADPTKSIKLNLDIDNTGIKDKIKAFIDEYNSVMSFIKEQTKVEVKDNKDSSGNKSTVKSAILANDSSVRRLKSQLQSLITSPVKELEGKTQFTSLSRIGITTDRQSGLLEVDDEKLDDAIATDLDGVKSLFITKGYSTNPQHTLGRFSDATKAGVYEINPDSDEFDSDASSGVSFFSGTRQGDILMSKTGDSKGLSITAAIGSGSGTFTLSRGLASQMQMFVANAKDSVNGFFTKADDNYSTRLKDYDKRIEKLETQVETYRTRLTKEYASLEQSLQKLKSQSSSFLSQLG